MILFLLQKTEAFEKRMYAHPMHSYEDLDKLYTEYQDKLKVCYTRTCTYKKCYSQSQFSLSCCIVLSALVERVFCSYFFPQIGNDIKVVKLELKKKRSLLQMDELKCRKRVLRRMAYCSASDVIEMKGRVACEIDRFSKEHEL